MAFKKSRGNATLEKVEEYVYPVIHNQDSPRVIPESNKQIKLA